MQSTKSDVYKQHPALTHRWLPPQLAEFDRQSQAKLGEMSASDVPLLLEAFKVYGYAPSEAWLQQFAGG